MLYHFQVIWRWIIVTLKRSLKVIQTGTVRKLGCGFLFAFHSNHGRIFHHLWNIQRQRKLSCSRSLKTAPFGRSYTTFYWSAIVNIAQSCTVFELFDVNNRDLEIWVRGHSVIRTGTIRKLVCGFLFAFHSNYGRIFNRLWDIQRQSIAWPWKLG